ncbi:MAG: phage head morphosis protein family [Burkholderiales bacterium]|jgi:SPP1 gp7 family putative phage head morphogenesis protein|nr:phage head morphosis protein family [Burkholderiales bacterium]
MTVQMLELEPIQSNRDIESKYHDELLTFFSSGVFLFDIKNGGNQIASNPIKLQNALIDYYSNDKLKKLTNQIFGTVNSYHYSEFDSQVNTIMGKKAPNIESNNSYQDYTEQLQFMNYIVTKNLRDDFIYDVLLSVLLQRQFYAPKQLENQIINSAVNKINQRIEIISSDQVIKITQGLTIAKCKALGLNQYIWQTMEDDLVRPTHAANNGKIFDWDNPPEKTGHPGTEINCRCKPKIIVNSTMANLLDLM